MQASHLFRIHCTSYIAPVELAKKTNVSITFDHQNQNLCIIFEKSPSLFLVLKLVLSLKSHRKQKIWLLPIPYGAANILLKNAIELLCNNKVLFYEIVKQSLLIFDRSNMRRSMSTTQQMLLCAINPSSLYCQMQHPAIKWPHGPSTRRLLAGIFKKRTLNSLVDKALLYLLSKVDS